MGSSTEHSTPGSSERFPPDGPWSYVRRALRWILMGVLLMVALSPLRDIPAGIETAAELEVSSMDEAAMVHRVIGNLDRGDLDPQGEFNYGAFYP